MKIGIQFYFVYYMKSWSVPRLQQNTILRTQYGELKRGSLDYETVHVHNSTVLCQTINFSNYQIKKHKTIIILVYLVAERSFPDPLLWLRS